MTISAKGLAMASRGGTVAGVDDHLFGEIQVLCREGVVHLGQSLDGAGVQVEAGAVGDRAASGSVRIVSGYSGCIAVVVVQDDFGVDSGGARRGRGGSDEDGLFGRLHHHAGRVFRVKRLVLDGDGIDMDTLRLHAL